MNAWTSDELDRVATADELEIMSLRRAGTLTKPVTIWVVRAGDDLYVRSYKGHGGSWFRAARVRREGRISSGGVEKDVTFLDAADPQINAQIDVAYRTKYRRYSAQYVDSIVSADARGTTMKLAPR